MKKVLKIVTNKYFITVVLFAVWSLFFDQNDWLAMRQHQKELNVVKGNIAYLQKEIGKMESERDGLLTDKRKMEQYARETYRMKHDGEDVFVIDTEGK